MVLFGCDVDDGCIEEDGWFYVWKFVVFYLRGTVAPELPEVIGAPATCRAVVEPGARAGTRGIDTDDGLRLTLQPIAKLNR